MCTATPTAVCLLLTQSITALLSISAASTSNVTVVVSARSHDENQVQTEATAIGTLECREESPQDEHTMQTAYFVIVPHFLDLNVWQRSHTEQHGLQRNMNTANDRAKLARTL